MAKITFPVNFPVPDNYLIELGRATALWGNLEKQVDHSINYLSGLQPHDHWRVAVLIAHSNFKQKIDIIDTLCNELQKQFSNLSTYQETTKIIRSAQKMRNHFFHNGIGFDEETERVRTSSLTARGTLKVEVRDVNISELIEFSGKIHESLLSLHGLITGKYYPPVWKRK
jgi:hypothetical protein